MSEVQRADAWVNFMAWFGDYADDRLP